MASSRKKPGKKRPPAAPAAPENVSEKCLHAHCQQHLEKTGLFDRVLIFHVPNERKGGIGAIMHFKRMGVRPGVADYLAFPASGRRVAIELKDADGEARKSQDRFARQWTAAGGEYFLVRTLDDFRSIVDALELF